VKEKAIYEKEEKARRYKEWSKSAGGKGGTEEGQQDQSSETSDPKKTWCRKKKSGRGRGGKKGDFSPFQRIMEEKNQKTWMRKRE